MHRARTTGVGALLVALALLAAACDWGMVGYGPEGTNANPTENQIGAATVSSLAPAWTVPLGIYVTPSPVVTGSTVFVNSTDPFIRALSPTDGSLQFSAALARPSLGAPAVSGGRLYVGEGGGRLSVFDAAGVEGCTGTPAVCQPLWTAEVIAREAGHLLAPIVADGVVYVTRGSSTGPLVAAYDASGATGCGGAPATCTPLWSNADTGRAAAGAGLAVGGGTVYATTSDGMVYAYATNTAGCEGAPKRCAHSWFGFAGDAPSPPAVAGGVVYVASNDGLVAFDGTTNCTPISGHPLVCWPAWIGAGGGGAGSSFGAVSPSVAIANGTVYAAARGGTVRAFDADGGDDCTSAGIPTCQARWRGTATVGRGGLSMANGLVYAWSAGSILAFDSQGATGCDGTPVVCAPVWQAPTSGSGGGSSPVIANGALYLGAMSGAGPDSTLTAWRLPAA